MILLYFFLLSLNAILIIANGRIEYTRNSPFSIFWVAYFFNYFIYMASDFGEYTFQATPRTTIVSIDHEILITAQLFILLFNILGFLYLCISQAKFAHIENINESTNKFEFITFLITALFVMRIIYKLYTGDQGQGFAQLRENATITSLIFDTYFKYIFVGTVVYYIAKSRYIYGLILLALLLADFILFGGGRQFFILALIGIVSVLLMIKKYSFSVFFVSFALIPAGVMIAKILVFFRNLPDFQARLDFLLAFDWETIQRSTTNEYDLRFAFYHFIERQNELPDTFFSLSYFMRTLLFWLPSSLSFGLKPSDFEYEMYAVYAQEFGGSLHATFHGSIFADSGWFLLPWLVLFIVLREVSARLVFNTSKSASVIIWFGLVYLSIMWARGSLYAPIVVNFFILTTLLITVTFFNLFKSRQITAPPHTIQKPSQ